jgi:transposase
MPIPNRLFAGIDVSQRRLDLSLLDSEGNRLCRHRAFPNTLPGYQQLQAWLVQTMTQYDFEELHIGAEATSYYWLPVFLQFDTDAALAPFHLHLYLLNARWVHWYKRSLSPDHKDDFTDPEYIADRIRTRGPASTWHYDPRWLPLRLLTRFHAHLTKSLVREKNLAHLYLFLLYTDYHPGHPFSDPLSKTSRQILAHPEWLTSWQKLDPDQQSLSLQAFSGKVLRDPDKNAQALHDLLLERFPLPEEMVQQVQFILEQLLEVITALEAQIAKLDQRIAALLESGNYPEVSWLDSIPGIGQTLASGLAAEIGGLERFCTLPKWDDERNAYRLRTTSELEDAIGKIAGLWWPKNASGSFEAEERPMSKEGNAYLRYYILEAAESMRLRIPVFQAYYQSKYHQATKHKHKRAVVLTGRKALGLFVALLHHRETYRAKEGETV